MKHMGLVWTPNGYMDKIITITDPNATIDYTLKVTPNYKIYLKKKIRGAYEGLKVIPGDPSQFYDPEFGEPLDCSLVLQSNS